MPQFLAVDVDARAIIAVSGAVQRAEVTITSALAVLDGIGLLTTETATELGNRLAETLKREGIRSAPLYLLIGRDRCIIKEVKHPPVPAVDEPAIVRFQALKELTESADDGVIDYCPIPGTLPSGEKRAMVVFVRNEVMAAARALAQAAGLKLAGVTPRPFLAAPLLLGRNADPLQVQGILSIWPTGGELTVVQNEAILFSRPIPPTAITDDPKRLAGEIRRNLSVYAAQQPDRPLVRLWMPEPPIPGVSWSGRLASELPVPVEAFDPLDGLASAAPDQARSRMAAPVGLLRVLARPSGLPINFVTPRQPKADANPNRSRILLAALVGIAACATLAVVGFWQVDQATRRLVAATNDAADVDRQLAQLEVQAKRLAAADEFTNREIIWLDEIYDLAERFPDNRRTRLQELEATSLVPRISGSLKTPSTGSSAGGATGGGLVKKPVKPQPVGQLVLTLATDDAGAVEALQDGLSRDPYYAGTSKSTSGLASAGSRLQQFTLKTQLLHRPAEEYRRRLTVTMPKPPTPPAPAPSSNGGTNGGAANPGGFNGGFDFGGGLE